MRKLQLMLAMLMLTMCALAQQKMIVGSVTNKATRQPVPDVSVQGPSRTVVTDRNGKFSIQAAPGDILRFTHVGMGAQTVRVGLDMQEIDIVMEDTAGSINEVVVVGYKAERKRDITGAVSVVNVSEATKESNINIFTSLQGRIPGVTINNDGTPGGTGTTVLIRGFSTTGSTGPLYVIDGVPTTNATALTSADIESIQVLKDAASATIYGARANNGVIVVTTKRGKSGKAEITVNSFLGVQQLEHRLHFLNTQQYGQAVWQAYEYSGLTPTHSVYGKGATPVAAPFIDPGNTEPTANTDWLGTIYHKSAITSNNVGISKATDKSTFYLGFDYDRDNGIQRYSDFQKISTRLNSSFNLDKFVVGENLQVSNFNQLNFGTKAMNDAVFQFPYIPVYDTKGNFGGPWSGDQSDKRNPLGELYNNRNNVMRNWRLFGNVYAEAYLVKGLTLRTTFGVDYTNFYLRAFSPTYTEGSHGNPIASLTTSSNFNFNYVWTNTANYHFEVNRHSVDIFGGVEAVRNRLESNAGTNTGYISNDYNYAYLGTATGSATATGIATENSLLSQFGKLNYSYDDKYLFSATVRRDGSSRFGTDHRYGVFPAFSAGWRINKETFLSQVSEINDLKLRGSWGKTGNQEIGDYSTTDFYRTNSSFSNYNLAGTPTGASAGYYASQLGNPNLKWESQVQTDIGADFTGFNDHINVAVDWYNKQTSDLLINPALLAVVGGATAPFVNSGKVENKGWEFAVGYQNSPSREFHWRADFNLALNRNKVLALTENVPYITTTYGRIEPGHAMNEFYGYVAQGVFHNQKEVDDYKATVKSGDFQAAPGRIRYKDLNGDGVIDANDRQYIGSPYAKFNYGFNLSANFKGFDASVFFSGVYGNKIFNEDIKYSELNLFASNFDTRVLNAWTPTNPNSNLAALQETLTNDEGRTSTYFVESGSYLKLKSIQIGYTILKRAYGIKNLRFYVQGENLLTFTKYTGMDPESINTTPLNRGVDFQGMLYPHAKSVNVGLNLNF